MSFGAEMVNEIRCSHRAHRIGSSGTEPAAMALESDHFAGFSCHQRHADKGNGPAEHTHLRAARLWPSVFHYDCLKCGEHFPEGAGCVFNLLKKKRRGRVIYIPFGSVICTNVRIGVILCHIFQ